MTNVGGANGRAKKGHCAVFSFPHLTLFFNGRKAAEAILPAFPKGPPLNCDDAWALVVKSDASLPLGVKPGAAGDLSIALTTLCQNGDA